tara:strand:+ start:696 stop:1997 length:1302 start_codon:yes stop_codon:yes gene_type:complete
MKNITSLKTLAKVFDELFPLNRSLISKENEKTLKVLKKYIPFKVLKFKTGKKINSWTIPREWNVKDAYIACENKKIIDFKRNNLHLVGYSKKIKAEIPFKKLKKKLFFSSINKSAIPYVTNYYNNDWGFCLSKKTFNNLSKTKKYNINIDAKFSKSSLKVAEATLKGKTNKTFIFDTYICHPSMANNELSGPLCMLLIYNMLRKIKNKQFTYKFIISSETIGPISYLDYLKNKKQIKNIYGAAILTCVGMNKKIFFKSSKYKGHFFNKLMRKSINKKFVEIRFDPSNGSNDRQYSSPGYNIESFSLMNLPYSKYSEYHTSLDNKKIFSLAGIKSIASIYLKFLKELEKLEFYKSIYPFGEPFMKKFDLYHNTNKNEQNIIKNRNRFIELSKWILSYSDGNTSLQEISKISKNKIKDLIKVKNILLKKKLILKI